MSQPPPSREIVASDDPEHSRLPGWLVETPYWAISGVAHLVLLLIFGSLILLEVETKVVRKPLVVRESRRPEYTPPLRPSDVFDTPQIMEPNPDNQPLSVTPEPVFEIPKGREDNLINTLRENCVADDHGLGGGTAGERGDPAGLDGRLEGTGWPGTRNAVTAALRWLKRHQHSDGHWSASDYGAHCVDAKCRCENAKTPDELGFAGHDVGVTALAMLAFLGAGHTHRSGEYPEFVQVMKRAKKWMMKQQEKSADDMQIHGRIDHSDAEGWVYNHALATMAMAELLYLSNDRFTGLPAYVEDATRYILRARNPSYAWRYEYQGGANDTSITGWMVLALKTAKGCSALRLIGVQKDEYQPAFDGALAWFDRTTSKLNGITGYQSPGDQGSQLRRVHPDPYPYSKELSCMTAVGVLCRLFAGQSKRDEKVKRGVQVLTEHLPRWQPALRKKRSTINMYYWYYATYALFQYDGAPWRRWNQALLETLIPMQRQGSCEDGSWDPVGEWGVAGGRVYSTAIGAMTLEVYYRYRRVSELSKDCRHEPTKLANAGED